MVKQYDILKVDLKPVKGREEGEFRPCAILSNTTFNTKTKLVWVAPITTRDIRFPTDVPIQTTGNVIYGLVDMGQIRTLDLNEREHTIKDTLHESTVKQLQGILSSILNI